MVSLNQLINGMGSMVSRTIGDAILFEFKLDPTLWNARLDPSQTEMALLNIVINSRDAMPNGGRITVQTSNIDAIGGEDLYQLTPGRYAMVSITDTGCGMPEAILKRVMDPFFTTKEEGKGTGLGLSMVYGFAKQSGGMVRIYSECRPRHDRATVFSRDRTERGLDRDRQGQPRDGSRRQRAHLGGRRSQRGVRDGTHHPGGGGLQRCRRGGWARGPGQALWTRRELRPAVHRSHHAPAGSMASASPGRRNVVCRRSRSS